MPRLKRWERPSEAPRRNDKSRQASARLRQIKKATKAQMKRLREKGRFFLVSKLMNPDKQRNKMKKALCGAQEALSREDALKYLKKYEKAFQKLNNGVSIKDKSSYDNRNHNCSAE